MKKFIVTGRNLQSQEKIYCRREKFCFRGQNFLSEQEILFWRNKFLAREKHFFSEVKISGQRKKFVVRGRNFLSEEEISFQMKNLMLQEEISCCRIQLLFTGLIFSLMYGRLRCDENATKMREFGLKFPVSPVRCRRFPAGNTRTPAGKITTWLHLWLLILRTGNSNQYKSIKGPGSSCQAALS